VTIAAGNISKANPAVVTVDAADISKFVAGGDVYFDGLTGAFAAINGIRTVGTVNAGAFTFTISGINSSGYSGTSNAATGQPMQAGIWHNGAIWGVNYNGAGRRFKNGIYRSRWKFTATKRGVPVTLTAPFPPLFPGPLTWGYGWEYLYYRTRPRIEQDYGEYVGLFPSYVETNLHVHNVEIYMPDDPWSLPDDQDSEVANYTIGSAGTGWSYTPTFYDSNWHEQVTLLVDRPGTCITWIDGVEFARWPSSNAFEQSKFFIGSHFMFRPNGGRDVFPDETVTQWFDSFEVLYPDTFIAAWAAPFTARPTLSYSAGAYTCTPNVVANHIEYRWYVNGVPVVLATGPTLTMASTTGVQCHVKAVSLKNQPEAWTAKT
jgi:hypothetical protein